MTRERLILFVLFSGFVVLLFTVPRVASWIHQGDPGKEYGFHLEESAHSLGIDFVYEVSPFDPKIENITPWIQAMHGASVAICDFNNDGWPDIYVTNTRIGSKNRLYINHGGKRFEEVAEEAGIADVNRPGTGISTGAACADYDNDGYEDLLLYKWGNLELFRNDGDGTFTRVTQEAGLGEWIYASDAIWWDFNRDGCLDIYVGAYWRAEHNLWNLNTTRIMQDDFDRSRNGGRNKLYEQTKTGDRCAGTFKEVSRQYGLDDTGWTLGVGAADLDGNGFPDLYVANDYGPDALFLNIDGSHFKKLIERHGIGDDTKKGMNVAFGDFKNLGWLSIYVTNITEPGYLVEGNMLWENLGNGQFRDVAWNVGAADCGWAWGAVFGDLNNDGHLDIYCANGMVSAAPKTEYWYDLFTMSVGINLILEDAATWPPMKNKSWSGYQLSRVFLNDGKGRFRDVAEKVGVHNLYDGRGVALADLDRDGALDLVVANLHGPLLVYLNHVDPGRKWIQFRLKGTKSNRSAIGTEITLYWNNQKQVQVLDGGGGHSGHSEKLLHFGLGENPKLDHAEIRWPSGRIQLLRQLEPNRLYVVEEPQ
ncbi:MAG: CRTAC1 family protein [Deltaproteobacteria bacterium]|nr:CRTAC1 family protein [Deltaproteobacteria bacterium]